MCFSFRCIHQLYRDSGQEVADRLLARLGERTSDTLFFEPASQKNKYGDRSLPFEDFDRDSIVEYNRELFESVMESDCDVEYLGSSRRMEAKEGERHMFAARFE